MRIVSNNTTPLSTNSDLLKLTFEAKNVEKNTIGEINIMSAILNYANSSQVLEAQKYGIKVEVKADQNPPVITIISPEAKTYLNTESITPQITVADIGDEISGVNDEKTTILLDGNVIEIGKTIPLYTLDIGKHTIIVNAYDIAGNLSSKTVIFEIDVSVETIKTLIDCYTEFGWIKEKGIANSLKVKLDEKDNSVNAFIQAVKAQEGKHISEIAAKYLLRDAEALLEK